MISFNPDDYVDPANGYISGELLTPLVDWMNNQTKSKSYSVFRVDNELIGMVDCADGRILSFAPNNTLGMEIEKLRGMTCQHPAT